MRVCKMFCLARFSLTGFDGVSCHVGKGMHVPRNRGQLSANSQQGTEALRLITLEELSPANNQPCKWAWKQILPQSRLQRGPLGYDLASMYVLDANPSYSKYSGLFLNYSIFSSTVYDRFFLDTLKYLKKLFICEHMITMNFAAPKGRWGVKGEGQYLLNKHFPLTC